MMVRNRARKSTNQIGVFLDVGLINAKRGGDDIRFKI